MSRQGRIVSAGLGRCSYAGFVIYGVMEILVALTLAVVYFKIRSFTTSLDKVETVPTYANAIMLMCTGILNIVLYTKRDPILLWPTGALCVICLLFFSICAILSGIQTANTFQKIETCAYNVELYQCECYMVQGQRSGNSLIVPAMSKLVYEGAPSCDAIRTGLRYCTYVLYGLYALGAVLCLCGFLMVLVVNNKSRKRYPIASTDGDYIELIRTSSIASNLSGVGAQNVDHSTRQSRERAESPRNASGAPQTQRRHMHRRRRKAKFCKHITLPGMGFCLLNQQLRLPGEEDLQLLSVQRTSSFDRPLERRPSPTDVVVHDRSRESDPAGISPGVQLREVNGSGLQNQNMQGCGSPVGPRTPSNDSFELGVRRSDNECNILQRIDSPGALFQDMHSPMAGVQNIDGPRHLVPRTDSSTHVLYRIDSPRSLLQRTENLPPGIHRGGTPVAFTQAPHPLRTTNPGPQRPRVQRCFSLLQASSPGVEYRNAARVGQRELTRSQSDTIQGQRAVNLFRVERAVQQNRNIPPVFVNRSSPHRAAPHGVLPNRSSPGRTAAGVAQRSQSDRVQRPSPASEHCSHCREYRRFRRVCRAYSSCLPAPGQAYPLPQHVMFMNYLLSTQGRGERRGADLRSPGRVYEPPPPYQEDGPPPYSPGPYRRSLGCNS